MKSYGELKWNLIRDGVFVPPEVCQSPLVSRGFFSSTPGEELVLALADDFIVKVEMKPDARGRAALNIYEGSVRLRSGKDELEIGVIPLPGFLKKLQATRSPIAENTCLDGYCFNIFLRAVGTRKKLNLEEETILSVIESAFAENAADLAQLNMDYCEEPDRGFRRVEPVIRSIKKKFQTFVGLRGFPPRDKRTIDQMYAAGADLVNFPLEGFAGTTESGNLVSAEEVYEALEYSAEIFPPGTVWTELVVASSRTEETREKIDRLTARGIIPILKLQRESIPAQNQYDRVMEVVEHLEKAAARDKLVHKWLYPNCRFVTPLDTRFFTAPPSSARLAVRPVYQSTLARKASGGFAALRRKLRIKKVSDSYESAGL